MPKSNGCPSLHECAMAFSHIVDLLDGEYDPQLAEEDDTTHDGILAQISDIASGFWRDIIENGTKGIF